MIETDTGLFTSLDTTELEYHVFGDSPFCNEKEETSIVFDKKVHKLVNLDLYRHPS